MSREMRVDPGEYEYRQGDRVVRMTITEAEAETLRSKHRELTVGRREGSTEVAYLKRLTR